MVSRLEMEGERLRVEVGVEGTEEVVEDEENEGAEPGKGSL